MITFQFMEYMYLISNKKIYIITNLAGAVQFSLNFMQSVPIKRQKYDYTVKKALFE